jgi:hypothetical protein
MTPTEALQMVLKMAEAEVDRPGDNENRFRMLVRIRNFVRTQLAPGTHDAISTAENASPEAKRQ